MIDAHKCSTLVGVWSCVYRDDNPLNNARARGLLSSMNQVKLKLNCITEKKGRRGIQVYFPITFNSNAFNFLRLFVSGSDVR